jgi:hypothetical protein
VPLWVLTRDEPGSHRVAFKARCGTPVDEDQIPRGGESGDRLCGCVIDLVAQKGEGDHRHVAPVVEPVHDHATNSERVAACNQTSLIGQRKGLVLMVDAESSTKVAKANALSPQRLTVILSDVHPGEATLPQPSRHAPVAPPRGRA